MKMQMLTALTAAALTVAAGGLALAQSAPSPMPVMTPMPVQTPAPMATPPSVPSSLPMPGVTP
jgi:hypothetical protein